MRRLQESIALLLAAFLAVAAAAQSATEPDTTQEHSMPGMPGVEGEMMRSPMTNEQMTGMMQMMMQCAAMMETMQGNAAHRMGMMAGDSPSYDLVAAEALARAFLAGQAPGATIAEVTPVPGGYEVNFRRGDTRGVLKVDASTGEVQPISKGR